MANNNELKLLKDDADIIPNIIICLFNKNIESCLSIYSTAKQ